MTEQRDLVFVMVFAALAAPLLALGILPTAVQIMLGLPLVIALPGYALSSAMFSRGALSTETRILLSLGLSIVIAVIGGLALNWTAWGLQTATWAIYLGAATLIFGTIAALRGQVPAPARPEASPLTATPAQVVLLMAAIMVLLSAIVMRLSGVSRDTTAFTQLWITPVTETGQASELQIGIRCMEPAPVTYRLVMQVEGVPVQEWPEISLEPHEEWQDTVSMPEGASASDRVELLLYTPDSPQVPYRQVFWVVK